MSDLSRRLDVARRLFESHSLTMAEAQLLGAGTEVERSADALVLLGAIAARTGRAEEGLVRLQAALTLDPDRYDALTWLAKIRSQQGDAQAAANLLVKALAIKSDEPMIVTELGMCQLALGQPGAAEASFRAALALAPQAPQVHFNLGMALRMQNRLEDGLDAFRRALELAPDHPTSYLQVFKQLQQLSRWDEAIECLEQGLKRLPTSALLAEALGSAYGRVGRREDAERVFLSFSNADPSVAQAYADWLQQEGRFSDSVSVLNRSIQLRPVQGAAYRSLAEAKSFRIGSESLIERAESLIELPELGERDRMHLAYALGKAYDHAGDYARAMHNLDLANEFAFRTYPVVQTFDPDKLAAETTAIEMLYTPELIGSFSAGVEAKLIFIVGMIRSGTTLLDQILSSHPAIASVGEQPFWNAEADRANQALANGPDPTEIERLAKRYLSVLEAAAPNSPRVTDKMPLNFRHLGLIHLAFPQAKIVHIRRHPVDTCLSIYSTFFGGGPNFTYRKENIVAYYREYLRLMEHWRGALPGSSMFELDYENLVADPEPIVRSLIQFLGLPWDDACLRHEENAGLVSTPSRWQARQAIYQTSAGRWRRYEPYLGAFAGLV